MGLGPLIPASSQIAREVPPPFPIDSTRASGANVYPPLPAQDSVLREYLRVLIKRKWVVVASLVAIFAVVTIATLRSTPIYEASGSIAINRSDPGLMNFKDSQNGGSDYFDPTDLDTEVGIL